MDDLTDDQWGRYDELLRALRAALPDVRRRSLEELREGGEDPAVVALLEVAVALAGREREPGPVLIEPGATLGGYRILGLLGRGGMGQVYRARQEALGREVALKFIRAGDQSSGEERARFQQEGRAIARLRHDNIVTIHEWIEGGEQPYFSMEYMGGGSLTHRLKERGGILADKDAALLIEQLARAAHHAHDSGVVHRDIKPDNVLFTEGGAPKLSDFGLAKIAGDPTLTRTGAVLGTPQYMAPEQFEGASVGPAADVYALGAVLYECLTGQPPFKGTSAEEVLRQALHTDPTPPRRARPAIRRDLETICLKCLQKETGRRYGSAAELADDLKRFREGEPIRARPPSALDRAAKWARKNRGWAALVGFAMFALALGSVAGRQWWVNATSAEALRRVSVLVETDPDRADSALKEVEESIAYARPYLQEAVDTSPLESRANLHARLALLPADPAGQIEPIVRRVDSATPKELLLLQERLRPYADRAGPILWEKVPGAADARGAALRQLGLLAALDPLNGRWGDLDSAIAEDLARQDVLLLGDWIRVFRPARKALTPALVSLTADDRLTDLRPTLVRILVDYAQDQPDRLADALLRSGLVEHDLLWRGLENHANEAKGIMRRALSAVAPAGASEAEKDRAALTRAKAASVLLWLGDEEPVWPLLERAPDQRVRSYLIHLLALGKLDPGVLVHRFRGEQDAGRRQALLLALGEFKAEKVADVGRLADELLGVYRDDPDPGVHGAADWLLRQRWGRGATVQQVDDDLRREALKAPAKMRLPPAARAAGGGPPTRPTWFVDAGGRTMALVRGPVSFEMGSPASEPDRQRDFEGVQPLTVGRSFAICCREVTFREFQAFLRANPAYQWTPHPMDRLGPDDPVTSVSWYDAAAFCNWLSREERLDEAEWCYLPKAGQFADGMQIAGDFLRRAGYRLATEAEWEYACRAGTVTPRHYGFSEPLLGRYAWYQRNGQDRPQPCGRLKPNDLGLFDTLGNALEWVNEEREKRYVEGNLDRLDRTKGGPTEGRGLLVLDGQERSLRGGTFTYTPRAVRAAMRFIYPARSRQYRTAGFRIARTVREADLIRLLNGAKRPVER